MISIAHSHNDSKLLSRSDSDMGTQHEIEKQKNNYSNKIKQYFPAICVMQNKGKQARVRI